MDFSLLSTNHILAECPIYSKLDNKIYWVDITADKVFSLCLKSYKKKYLNIQKPSAIFLTSKMNFIIILNFKGLHLTNFKSIVKIANFRISKNFRTNDAKAINSNEIIYSIMHNKKEPKGKILKYNLKSKKSLTLKKNISIPNSILNNKNNFFFSDSKIGKIYKFNYKSKKCEIFNRHDKSISEPDGSVFSKEQKVINADYLNSCINIYDKKGFLEQSISLPCKNPTSLSFFGDKMDKIIVTSAKTNIDGNIFDGSVFMLNKKISYSGVNEPKIKL